MEEKDPCETCLFTTRCREFCEKGIKYHKKRIFLSLGETNLRRFKLEALLLVTPIKSDEFLRAHPNLREEEIDDVRDGDEFLKNLIDRPKNGSMKSKETKKRELIKRLNLLNKERNKSKRTMRLNLFVRKNNRKKNLFKGFLSRAKELIKWEETK